MLIKKNHQKEQLRHKCNKKKQKKKKKAKKASEQNERRETEKEESDSDVSEEESPRKEIPQVRYSRAELAVPKKNLS